MNEKSVIKIAMRATKKTAHKKGVIIQDDCKYGLCRYVSTNRDIFRVMLCNHNGKPYAETVPFVGY